MNTRTPILGATLALAVLTAAMSRADAPAPAASELPSSPNTIDALRPAFLTFAPLPPAARMLNAVAMDASRPSPKNVAGDLAPALGLVVVAEGVAAPNTDPKPTSTRVGPPAKEPSASAGDALRLDWSAPNARPRPDRRAPDPRAPQPRTSPHGR